MFKDIEEYKEYLMNQGIEQVDIDKQNYFEHTESGEIIIRSKDYNISSIYVDNYTNCIRWILLKDNKTMALLKYPFGDIYRKLNKEQYDVALYNNILLPKIAEQFLNESAQYYIVEGNRLSNNRRHLLTIDFKRENEELIHGEDVLEDAGGNINELSITEIINLTEIYLVQIGVKKQDIETIKREFIKQSLYNRFVKQADENNHNWGILINRKNMRARISPIYDVDCCCEVATLRKHIRTTQDGSQYSLDSFIKDFEKNKWFIKYIEEILENFDINKAIQDARRDTGIQIPQNIQDHYKTFLGEKYYELKGAYKEHLKRQNNVDIGKEQIDR